MENLIKNLKSRALLALSATVLGVSIALVGCQSKTSASSEAPKPRPVQQAAHATAQRPVPTAPGNSAESTSTIPIGMVICATGELSQAGMECLRAAKLAVEEINRQGGIQGKKVELLVEDSASNPEQGKTAAERLIAKGVLGIIGELTSGITAQIARPAFEKGIPVITIGGTRKDLTNIGAHMFRVCFTDDVQGHIMAKFAFEKLGVRKAGLFIDKKQPYSIGLCEAFKKSFTELGGQIVDRQYYESKQTNFSAQLTNVKSKRPDCLFLGGYYTEVGPLARQARALGLNVHKLGGDGWDGEEILTAGGQGILGGYFCTHYNAKDPRAPVQHFVKAWKEHYHRLPKTNPSALAYDATHLMLAALKQCETLNSRKLIQAIEQTKNFQGVTGSITLQGNHGNPLKGATIVEITPKGAEFREFYEISKITP
jgi:branched-chain amino acid transport system substrate-binding protein